MNEMLEKIIREKNFSSIKMPLVSFQRHFPRISLSFEINSPDSHSLLNLPLYIYILFHSFLKTFI